MSNINTILVSIHHFLYPWRDILLAIAAVDLCGIAIYYAIASRGLYDKRKLLKRIIVPVLFGMVIGSYSVLLNFQEPEFLPHLYVYFPLCVVPLPLFFVIYVVTALFFTEKARKRK